MILTCNDVMYGLTQRTSISDSGPYAFKVEEFSQGLSKKDKSENSKV